MSYTYELKIRKNANSAVDFHNYVVNEIQKHTETPLHFVPVTDEDLTKTLTICIFDKEENLVGVAHGYWCKEGDGMSRGKMRVFIRRILLTNWKE